VIISDQAHDSNSNGASDNVDTQAYAWEYKINLNGRREMLTAHQDSAKGATATVDIYKIIFSKMCVGQAIADAHYAELQGED
jgi:hypothetical protein